MSDSRSTPFWNLRLIAGSTVLAALLFTAVFAPWLAPHDPMEQDLLNQLLPPCWLEGGDPSYPLGTDNLGRDLLSRLLYGARPALLVMFAGATLSGLLGVLLGLLAGYFGGWPDIVVSRAVETFMSFPPMLLAIVLVAVVGPGLGAVIAAVIVIGWTRSCRMVRGEVMALREQEFVASAQVVGVKRFRIIFHEILPNLVPLLAVLFGLEMGRAIVTETILSFIGFSSSGISTWGGIIAEGRPYVFQAWWAMTYPIVITTVAVLGLNVLGDGLRDATDAVSRR